MNIKSPITLLFLILVTSGVSAQVVEGSPYIAVQGHAEKEVIPDEFPLAITLSDISTDVTKTQAKIEALAATALSLAKKNHLSDKDISIGNLNIVPDFKYEEKTQGQRFVGNNYSRKIDLCFRNLKDLKAFIKEFPAGKEIQMTTQEFSSSKIREIRNQLLKIAVLNAKADANVIAESVGKKIIGIHNVSNSAFSSGVSNYSNIGAQGNVSRFGDGFAADIVIAEGVTTIKQDVYIIYLLGQ
jgi:uncharacterized protein